MEFFERVSSGKTSLKQSGPGQRPRVIAVDQPKPYCLKTVIPSEQTITQAESELVREGINPKDVAGAVQSDSRRGKKQKSPEVIARKSNNNKRTKTSPTNPSAK